MGPKDKSIIAGIACALFVLVYATAQYENWISHIGKDTPLFALLVYFDSHPFMKWFAQVVLSYYSFSFLFGKLVELYANTSLWSVFNNDVSLNGKWLYIFDDTENNCAVFGYFNLKHGLGRMHIDEARCWYGGTESLTESTQRGTWSSRWMMAHAEWLWFAYEMYITNTINGVDERIYYGVMKLQIYTDSTMNTKALQGKICDHDALISHSGKILAKRLTRQHEKIAANWNNLPQLYRDYFGRDLLKETECSGRGGATVLQALRAKS